MKYHQHHHYIHFPESVRLTLLFCALIQELFYILSSIACLQFNHFTQFVFIVHIKAAAFTSFLWLIFSTGWCERNLYVYFGIPSDIHPREFFPSDRYWDYYSTDYSTCVVATCWFECQNLQNDETSLCLCSCTAMYTNED